MRTVCSWCGVVKQKGSGPTSHGMCEICATAFKLSAQKALPPHRPIVIRVSISKDFTTRPHRLPLPIGCHRDSFDEWLEVSIIWSNYALLFYALQFIPALMAPRWMPTDCYGCRWHSGDGECNAWGVDFDKLCPLVGKRSGL